MRTRPEAADLPGDDPIRELRYAREACVDDRFDVAFESGEVHARLRDDLHRGRLWLLDGSSDLGHDADPDLLHGARVLGRDPVRELEREEVVQLAYMGDGVLAGRGFHRHRSV